MGAQLNWQGAVVLLLLFLAVVLSKLWRKVPRDLLFTVAALLTALIGVVSSAQIFQSVVNQAIFAILGLWLFGKAMQQQGVFQTCRGFLKPVGKDNWLRRILFLCHAVLVGAFLNHRYFLLSTLRHTVRHAEKEKGELNLYGFPLAYLLLVGGLATAIGTPTNLLLLSLYSALSPEIITDIFAFFPIALLPILVSLIVLCLFRKEFRKIFSQFIDAGNCAVVPPDALLLDPAQPLTVVREGKSVSRTLPLQSGDLIVFNKLPTYVPFSQIALFSNSPYAKARWLKNLLIILLFLGALVATVSGVPVGTAFLCGGILVLLLHSFPVRKTFQEEFPLPFLLEIFSAYIFFFALQNSNVSQWLASFVTFQSPVLSLTLFFILAQVLAHFMPRPLAFSALFSMALVLFQAQPEHLLLISVNIAFATAIPLFGKPLLDETAISTAISGTSPFVMRVLLILILFATTLITTSLFWN